MKRNILRSFDDNTHLFGRIWGVVAAVLSCFSVYSILIGTGDFIYGKFQSGMIYALVVVVTMIGVIITWKKMNRKVN